PYRLWTDDTGEYRTVGRLVQITETHVRMLKDNGKLSTVSKTRLSKADLKYTAQMESVLGTHDEFDVVALR
ncbi:SHD1 domain-containing protein, partial [Planctomycetota bacterium]